jgi:hypothetical protein
MAESRQVAVEFLAGPLDGWVSELATDAAPDLPGEWWPQSMRHRGFYRLTVENHGDHDFYCYRWHEAGRA